MIWIPLIARVIAPLDQVGDELGPRCFHEDDGSAHRFTEITREVDVDPDEGVLYELAVGRVVAVAAQGR